MSVGSLLVGLIGLEYPLGILRALPLSLLCGSGESGLGVRVGRLACARVSESVLEPRIRSCNKQEVLRTSALGLAAA